MTKEPETKGTYSGSLFEMTAALPPRLRVETVGGVTRVKLDALVLASFAEGDQAMRRMTMVGLAEGGGFKAKDVAEAFGVDPTRLSHHRKRFAEGGAALLLATRGGRPGPHGLNEGDIARVRAWRREGRKIDEILAIVNRDEKRTNRSTIGRLVKGLGLADKTVEDQATLPGIVAEAPALASLEATSAEATTSADVLPCEAPASELDRTPVPAPAMAPAPTPTASTSDAISSEPQEVVVRESKVAGAMVAHVAIAKLGLLPALLASGARLGGARTFDLVRTAAVILFGVLLRYRSIESMRLLVRHDFGALLEIARAPEIRTIRRKLGEIAQPATGFDGAAMVRSLAGSLLAAAEAPEGVYFFDDHFKPYHGKQPVAKGWDAKRRIAVPGLEDVYVHDMKGRAILFVPLEAPTSLSRAMPLALAELRAAGVSAPKLAVFDRGGWSRDLFCSLVHPAGGASRIDFLTYLRERKKRRELPLSSFRKFPLEEGKRGREVELAESTLEMKGFERPLRLIVLLDRKKGKQIPIITSDDTTPAAKLVHLLRARWRQENSFKYLVGELSIDALISRDVEIVADERLVPNPERVALKDQLTEAEDHLAEIDGDLGRTLVANREADHWTVRGLKIANADLNHDRKNTLGEIASLEEDVARLPVNVPRVQLDPEAKIARPRTRRRVFVNALKLLAHNTEKWLADRMGPGPYGAHALPVLRALFQQSGRITYLPDRVVVEIDALDTPRYQACVEKLFATLNADAATFLDSGKRIELKVAPSPTDGQKRAMS